MNYEDAIEKLCDWIAPWIDEPLGTQVGTQRYEDDDCEMRLIFQGNRIATLRPDN
ncbi:hypothetical protein [Trinickia dinghuensis]|uniref:hypothetical protein n=1 Tax=Trinickia dinghuensis TaxID=2291023 RepID=UPI0015F12EEA|nr:hypothetical protein [Trinickia dinghuensis]